MSVVRRVLALIAGTPDPSEERRQVFHDKLIERADHLLNETATITLTVNRRDDMRSSFRRAGERLGR